jgi:Mg-chelatase subunit ChlD
MKVFLFFFILISTNFVAQLDYAPEISLGNIAEASELRGSVVLKNSGLTKIYLLRADAETGVQIYTSRKTLNPGDTALLNIWFVPDKAGRFDKKIALVTSHRPEPSVIRLSGNLLKFRPDDRTACFYFGEKRSPRAIAVASLSPAPAAPSPPDLSNKLPERSSQSPSVSASPNQRSVPTATQTIVPSDTSALPLAQYRPNNLIFLVDVSGSMKDSLKLPLMKLALHTLIDQLRPVDKITFVTYADTVKVLAEADGPQLAVDLHQVVNHLKAKGMTKGKKAILFSQQLAQKHFIEGGNNQIIIATDGQFRFEKEDQKLWNDRQGNKPVVISTLAFGGDKDAMHNLKSLARKGKGNFVQIRSKQDSREKLLEEIKQQSRKEER